MLSQIYVIIDTTFLLRRCTLYHSFDCTYTLLTADHALHNIDPTLYCFATHQ